MGCGTGQLACEFAGRGHHVTGADPAAAMLAVARARPGGDRVRSIQAGAAGLATSDRYDLIVMTGHVFQLLLEDSDVRAALRVLARHLAPGGRIAFETRNPAVREWQDWNPRETRQRVEAAGLVADVHYDISAVTGELVTYETWFRFAGADASTDADGGSGDVVVPDTLRFMDQGQVAAFLAEAGLTRVTWYGDWDGSPCRPASPEIIAVASGTAGPPPGTAGLKRLTRAGAAPHACRGVAGGVRPGGGALPGPGSGDRGGARRAGHGGALGAGVRVPAARRGPRGPGEPADHRGPAAGVRAGRPGPGVAGWAGLGGERLPGRGRAGGSSAAVVRRRPDHSRTPGRAARTGGRGPAGADPGRRADGCWTGPGRSGTRPWPAASWPPPPRAPARWWSRATPTPGPADAAGRPARRGPVLAAARRPRDPDRLPQRRLLQSRAAPVPAAHRLAPPFPGARSPQRRPHPRTPRRHRGCRPGGSPRGAPRGCWSRR